MSSTAGRIRPSAPSTSATPIALMAAGLKLSVQPIPAAASCSFDRVIFSSPVARNARASRAAAIHRAMFMGSSDDGRVRRPVVEELRP